MACIRFLKLKVWLSHQTAGAAEVALEATGAGPDLDLPARQRSSCRDAHVDALRESLHLRDQFPGHDIKVRAMQ
jgi:hypothetical protein